MAFGDLKGTLQVSAKSIANPFIATGSVSVAIGDLIFCTLAEQTGVSPIAPTAVTDNVHGAGVNYTATNAGSAAGADLTGRSYYLVATSAGTLTAVNAACTASSHNASFAAAVFEGPFNTIDVNIANTTGTTTFSSPASFPATGTLAQTSELVVSWAVVSFSLAGTAASSPSSLALQVTDPGPLTNSLIEYRAVSSTSTVTQQFTFVSTGTDIAAWVFGTSSFKAAAAGPTAWDGQARFNAAGNLSVDADLAQLAGASFLDGDSAIRVYANLNNIAQATFGGSGNVSANSAKFKLGAITFAGSGNFSTNSIKHKFGEVLLSGNGNLSAYLSQGNQAAAILSAVGNFSVDATQVAAGGEVQQGSTTLIGSGSLNSLAILNQIAQARFNGIGNLQTLAFDVGQIVSTFSGSGNLSSAITQNQQVAAFLIGNGIISVRAQIGQNAFSTFTGSGNVSAYANLRMQAAATFGGLGNLSVAYQTASNEIRATFAGAGNLNAYALQQNIAAATFGGLGNLSAVAQGVGTARATLSGTGNLFALSSLGQQASARFVGNGILSATARLTLPAFAIFAANGNLIAAATLAMPIAARFGGIGNLFADGAQAGVQFGTVTLNGNGNLSAYALSALQAAVRLNAVGSLLSNQIKYKLISATFAGSSNLSATYTIVKFGEVRFEAASAVFASTISAQATAAIFSGESFMRADITGGRTRRVATRASISKLTQDARTEQAQDNRSDQAQTNRRLKTSHG